MKKNIQYKTSHILRGIVEIVSDLNACKIFFYYKLL